MKRFFFLFLFVFISVNAQTLKISGTLEGTDGKLIKADVHLQKSELDKPVKSFAVGEDGKFNIEIENEGVFFLYFTAVDHEPILLPVINYNKNRMLSVNVKLRRNNYFDEFNTVKIMGDFNDFSFGTAKEMKKENDGIFSFEIKTEKPEFRYQLLGLVRGRSINGTMSDDYEYDGGGDYRSVVKVNNGKVKVVFDPAKLVRDEREESVEFEDDNCIEKFLLNIRKKFNAEFNKISRAAREYSKKNGGLEGFTYSVGDFKDELGKYMNNNTNELKRKIAYLYYASLFKFGVTNIDENKGVKLFDEISPESFLWTLEYRPLLGIIQKYSGKDKYIESLMKNRYLSKEIKASILSQKFYWAKYTEKNDKKADAVYERLKKEYGETSAVEFITKRYYTEKKVSVGKKVPDFSVVSLEDSSVVYSNENLLGKVYLIDFWATWCVPCLGEMKVLHEAYDKYKEKGFEILSLSFDSSPSVVKKFRNEKWKMPWLHAFVRKSFSSEIAKKFEVTGIPKPVLVGKDGTILAVEGEVRGKNLDETLSKIFGDKKSE